METGLTVALIVFATAVAANFLHDRQRRKLNYVDDLLAREVGDIGSYAAYAKSLPLYRFADLHRAADRLADEAGAVARIASTHPEPLAMILAGRFYHGPNRSVRTPDAITRSVGEGKEAFFPTDGFLILDLPEGGGKRVIIRILRQPHTREAVVEIGAATREAAQAVLDRLLTLASTHSVYRGHTLEVSFETEIRDEHGDVEPGSFVDLRFRSHYAVAEADIVLDDAMRGLIDRLLIQFHHRRDELGRLGLPARRGVLLFGPPGTGKTYLCKYLAHRLDGVTTLVATGRALLHARSICQIARMLQPALVVLEDVDLVYSSREENAYGVALGELMDELDGFAADDAILFVLTTNAIERVEAAVKDRPGRISQCILFDLPGPALRQRYLDALTAPYDTAALDAEALTALTDRTSHAFLKELVFRAVQIAAEDAIPAEPAGLRLRLPHFEEALHEMKGGAGRAGAGILGFHAST